MTELLEYTNVSQDGAGKYVGAVASGYDAKRGSTDKWQIEQTIIENMLKEFPQGTWVFDGPCGTGRWFEVCHKAGHIYRGMDRSVDMIQQAVQKLGNQSPMLRLTKQTGEQIDLPQFQITQGDVLSTGLPDTSVDVVLNIRITRWLSPQECQTMFQEMQRIARRAIILTARVANHPHMRPLSLFESVMKPGWKLHESKAGYEPEYRIFQFRKGQPEQVTTFEDNVAPAAPDMKGYKMPPYKG